MKTCQVKTCTRPRIPCVLKDGVPTLCFTHYEQWHKEQEAWALGYATKYHRKDGKAMSELERSIYEASVDMLWKGFIKGDAHA